MKPRILLRLVALALLVSAPAQAARWVPGHENANGDWVRPHWDFSDTTVVDQGRWRFRWAPDWRGRAAPLRPDAPPVDHPTRWSYWGGPLHHPLGDPAQHYVLDLDQIFARPYKRASWPPSPPPGALNAERHRDRSLRIRQALAEVRRGARPGDSMRHGYASSWASGRSYGPGAAEEVVWTETATHRVKTKYRDGVEVGRWEFSKDKSSP